jgi:polar amino acid transport system substrate-binding protein
VAIAGFLHGGEAFVSPFWLRVEAAELDEIQERGYLIVAVKDTVRPLGFRTETDELAGLEIDIARRIATELLGTPDALVLEPVNNANRIPMLLNGEVDLVIAQLGVTGARSRVVMFSHPYYLDGTGFVTRNPAVQSLSDLSNGAIAVLNLSTTIDIVKSFFPNAALVGVESYEEALVTLEAGRADVFAADASILTGWVQEYPNYRLVTPLISGNGLAIAMPRGLQYQDLHQVINTAIWRWQREGWLEERATAWGLP